MTEAESLCEEMINWFGHIYRYLHRDAVRDKLRLVMEDFEEYPIFEKAWREMKTKEMQQNGRGETNG